MLTIYVYTTGIYNIFILYAPKVEFIDTRRDSSHGASQLGCPDFASKKVSLQSETKPNANGFASFSRNSGKNFLLHIALFRFKSFALFP